MTSVLLATAFLVGALLVFFDLIQPTYSDLQMKKGTELSTENAYNDAQQIVSQAKKLLSDYANSSQAQQNLALAMPSGEDIAGAVAQIYGIASANNITIKNITLSPPVIKLPQKQAPGAAGAVQAPLTLDQVAKPMGTISIQAGGSGSYESFKSFIQGLETNIRIFDVTAASIQPSAPIIVGGKTIAVQDLFNYSVTVATYYQLP